MLFMKNEINGNENEISEHNRTHFAEKLSETILDGGYLFYLEILRWDVKTSE